MGVDNNYNEYLEDIRIDENSLDIEWLEQASLAMKYGKIWNDAKKKVRMIEEQIKVTRSELIEEAYENPQELLNVSKATAQTVEAYYRNDEAYKELKDALIEAEHELNIIEIAKNEICFTRKSALENLVVLHGQQYFAGPKVPHNLTQLRNDRELQIRQANKKVKLKRTRKTVN